MSFSDPPRLQQSAERSLRVFSGEYARYGYHSASYARAVDAVTRPPLHIVIVGPADHPGLWPLRQAAWRVAVPGKAVEWLEDGSDRGFPAAPDGTLRAYICVGTTCTVQDDPDGPEWKTLVTSAA